MNGEFPLPAVAFDVIAADGYALAVRRHGNASGPRLVLSHGNGFAIDAYYPFWSQLTDRFDCFVYDMRNHGWNTVDDDRLRHNLPFIVSDSKRIKRAIERRFGAKPTVGVFHSLSSIVALHQASNGDSFAALVLFDPPLFRPGGLPDELRGAVSHMSAKTRMRKTRFESLEAFVTDLRRNRAFGRMSPAALDLFARTTLRRSGAAQGYELRCPPEYEAQILDHVWTWTMTVDLDEIRCPVKVIGADPTVPYSFIPSMDLGVLVRVDYDFVPEASHFLPLEQPETCAALMVEFLEEHGLAGEHREHHTTKGRFGTKVVPSMDRPRELRHIRD